MRDRVPLGGHTLGVEAMSPVPGDATHLGPVSVRARLCGRTALGRAMCEVSRGVPQPFFVSGNLRAVGALAPGPH